MDTLFIRVGGKNVPVAPGDEAVAEELVLEGAFAPALLPVVSLQAPSVAEASVEAKRVARVAKKREARAVERELKHAARLEKDAEAGRLGAERAAQRSAREARKVVAKREQRRLTASARAAQQPPLGLGGDAHDVHECPGGCTGYFETRSHGVRSLAVHAQSCTGAGGDELRACVRNPRVFSTALATVAYLASAEMSGYRYRDGSGSTILVYTGKDAREGRKQLASLGCRAHTRRPSDEEHVAQGQVERVLKHQVMASTAIAPVSSQHNSSRRRVQGRTAFLQHTQPCFARATVYVVTPADSSSAASSSASAPSFYFEVHVFDCHNSSCSDALSSQPSVYHGATDEVTYCLEQAKGNVEAAFALHESRCASFRSGTYGGSHHGPPLCFVCSRVALPMDPAPLVSCSGYQCSLEGYSYCVTCHTNAHRLHLEGVHRPVQYGDVRGTPPRPSTLPMSHTHFRLHAKSITDDGRRALFSSTFSQLSMLQSFSACPELLEMHIGGKCECLLTAHPPFPLPPFIPSILLQPTLNYPSIPPLSPHLLTLPPLFPPTPSPLFLPYSSLSIPPPLP